MTNIAKQRVVKDRPGEEWRPYPASPNIRVSNLGRVYAEDPLRPGRISAMPTWGMPDRKGYCRVRLRTIDGRQKSFMVHRLVALTWLELPEGTPDQVVPVDGNRSNNRPENLIWGPRVDIYYLKWRLQHQSMNTTFSRSGGSPVMASPY